MIHSPRISPCFWFNHQAEEAARFYTGIFPHSRVLGTTRYGEAGREHHGQPAGTVMTVSFELEGQPFVALNGGPLFQFNEALSLQVNCETQEEIDHYWERLTDGGDPQAQQCGWLKDSYGVSWQVVPRVLLELLASPGARRERVFLAVHGMRKLNLRQLVEA